MYMSLTDAQVVHYKNLGYVSPIDVFTEDEANAIRREFERAERAYPNELHAEHRNNAHLAFPLLAEICFNRRIVSAVQSLLGPDLLLWGSVLFIKEPDSAGFVSWHQDARYMGIEPHQFTTPWLALTESTLHSGCLSVIPGSHTSPLADHADTFAADNILTRGQEVAGVDEAEAVHLQLRPGQMSIHHPRLIHGSQPNRSSDRRIGFAMQSFLSPRVRQTLGHDFAIVVAGQDRFGHFAHVPAPSSEMAPEAVDVRRRVNENHADILYLGADQRRRL